MLLNLFITLSITMFFAALWSHLIVYNLKVTDGAKLGWRAYKKKFWKKTTLPVLMIVMAVSIVVALLLFINFI